MAAPAHVPQKPAQKVRSYQSPPRRPESWTADRPAEVDDLQPRGDRLGSQGPDQGYVYKLARQFAGTLALEPGEHEKDALAGACAIALKRASLFGRAPVVHDVRLALELWGYLGDPAERELVRRRVELFEEVSHPHHYAELRAIVDRVPPDVLRKPHAALTPADRATLT